MTGRMRSEFLQAFRRNEANLDAWLHEVAEGWEETRYTKDGNPYTVRTGKDPKGAAELLVRMAEYHLPKLGRLEHVGDGGGALQVIVRKYEGP